MRVGRRQVDAVEVERAEERSEQLTDLAGCPVQRGEHRRRHLGHLVRGGGRGDDLGTDDADLVAVAVIAVGMGVHQRADRALRCELRHRVEHRRGEIEVEQRVDEQRRTVADDQAGVAPSPAAIGLQVGEAPVAEFVQTVRVARRRRHRCILTRHARPGPPTMSETAAYGHLAHRDRRNPPHDERNRRIRSPRSSKMQVQPEGDRSQRALRRSASIVVGRCVLTSGIDGNTEASHTKMPS